MEQDLGKVLLFVNLTMDPQMREQTLKQLSDIQRVSDKYNAGGEPCFAAYG